MKYHLSNEQEINEAQAFLAMQIMRSSTVEIKVVRQTRSLRSNAYLHLLLGICGVEWGYTLSEVKTIWKRDIAPSIFVYYKSGKPFIKSSAGLDSKEMSNAIDLLKRYAAENELILPEPNEEDKLRYYQNQIEQRNYL